MPDKVKCCGTCHDTDGLVYLSDPSKVKCALTGCYHLFDDVCDVDDMLTPKTPCDLCVYNPPSSCDGKPCTICPACAKS